MTEKERKVVCKNIYNYMMEVKDTSNCKYQYYSIWRIKEVLETRSEEEICSWINNGLKNITERDLDIIYAKFLYNTMYLQVATVMNISTETVRTHVRTSIHRICNYIYAKNYLGEDAIEQSELSVRLINVLARAGIRTNTDLIGISYKKFTSFRNAGNKTWAELQRYMNNHGIYYHNKYSEDLETVKNKVAEQIIAEKYYGTYEEFLSKLSAQEKSTFDAKCTSISKALTSVYELISDVNNR